MTTAIAAAITTALTSLLTISCSVLPLCSLFVQYFLHRGDRVRQGRLYRVRQSHSRARVGRLARDHQAPSRPAAEGGKQGEDGVGRQAVRVDDRRGGGIAAV